MQTILNGTTIDSIVELNKIKPGWSISKTGNNKKLIIY